MRAYALFLPVLCVHGAVCLAQNPAVTDTSTAPVLAPASAGAKTASVKSPAFQTGKGKLTATYGLYSVDSGKTCAADVSKELAISAGTKSDATASVSTTLSLVSALTENSRICAVEFFKDEKGDTVETEESNVVTVTSPDANWGRVHAYFVGGILIANDSSAFSSAHQFYDLTLEKSWKLPGCYLRVVRDGKSTKECAADEDSAVEESSAKPSVDISGGQVTARGVITLTGGSVTLVAPIKIVNALATVIGAETIMLGSGPGAPSIALAPGQSFMIESGKLEGVSADVVLGGIQVPTGGVLKIVKGSVKPAASPLLSGKAKKLRRTPGFTSYFETRLTAIPVVSNGSNTSTSSTTGNSGSSTTGGVLSAADSRQSTLSPSASSGSGNSSPSTNSTSSFLTSQQTANVTIGVYFPFLLSRWDFNNTPNALFIAPLSKIGLNTITAPTSQQVVLPGGASGTQSFEQIYSYYSYGARVGHMGLTKTTNVAPEIYSYLDFVFGRYSNLESLICHTQAQGGGPVLTGSGCGNYNLDLTYESRKRLYRMDIEGLLKIPNTLFYVGLNANIGQKSFQAQKLDPAFKAPDDIRFLFGTKFDIATLFNKLGVQLP